MRLLPNSLLLALVLPGCAVLHHAQVGDFDNRKEFIQTPFDLKVSETGINLDEAADIAGSLSRNKQASKDIERVRSILALLQMGPRTGNPVYNENYAENILDLIYQKCPSGNITGLTSIRETRKYPVISGEIVKLTGTCLTKKGS